MKKSFAAMASAALLAAFVPAGSASAAACPDGYISAKVRSTIDWARVHKTPNSTAVVGQVAGGHAFCISSLRSSTTGGHDWDKGYGYNGSTKVSGWVADDLLTYVIIE